MTLKKIALKNLLRRKGKSGLVLTGLVVGIATVVTVITLVESIKSDINHKLEKFGANILIVPRTENLSLSYGGLSLGGISFDMQEIKADALSKINSIKNAANVAAVGPMVLGAVSVDAHRVLMAGIDFRAAEILKPWWRVKGMFPAENEVLIGSEAARIMGIDTGTLLSVKGRELNVSGILHPTGSQDDQLIFTRLATAQQLLGKTGLISMAEVAALCTACPIEEMVAQISGALPGAKVMAIQQVVKSRMETLGHLKKFSYGFSVVVILIGSLVVLVTMMSSVRERTREIGIFRAIGFRKSHVIRIVFTEVMVISALAGILGYAIGIGFAHTAFRLFTESRAVSIPFSWELAGGAFILSLFVGLLAGIYPAMIAARMNPNEALRAL